MVGGMATATATKNLVEDGKAELVDVMCGDLFDQIDDLLDFPNDDDVLGMVDPHGGPAPAPAFAPLLLPPLQADGLLPGGGEGDCSNGSDHGADGVATAFHRKEDKLGPCDEFDVGELEWLSNFFDDDDSFILDFPKCASTTTIVTNDGNNRSSNTSKEEEDSFRSSSPVSVLEPDSLRIGGSSGGGGSSSFSSSSSSCSGTGTVTVTGTGTGGGSSGARALEAPPVSHPKPILAVPARARSKRPRPATFSARPHVTIPSFPPSSGNIPVFSSSSDPESFGESPAPMKQKKKKKISVGTSAGGDEAPPVRKCMHCDIQKTPQWRAGPTGPKTLCNACGVRYKSGRLFPEYRPAASPTFVPSIHSNSHKKVVEMRIKASQRAGATGMPSPDSSARDSCDLLAYIRRKE